MSAGRAEVISIGTKAQRTIIFRRNAYGVIGSTIYTATAMLLCCWGRTTSDGEGLRNDTERATGLSAPMTTTGERALAEIEREPE